VNILNRMYGALGDEHLISGLDHPGLPRNTQLQYPFDDGHQFVAVVHKVIPFYFASCSISPLTVIRTSKPPTPLFVTYNLTGRADVKTSRFDIRLADTVHQARA
jgi:hypothetical protein